MHALIGPPGLVRCGGAAVAERLDPTADGFRRVQVGQRASMSIFDKVKGKAADLARNHGEKVAKGVDKAAEAANRRTGGQHADKIRDGAERAKRAVDDLGNEPPGGTSPR